MTVRAIRKSAEREPVRRAADSIPPIAMGILIEPSAKGWIVEIGKRRREVAIDPSVDPALLEEARSIGARVVIDPTTPPAIVGVLSTRRALSIDPDGRVDATVTSLSIAAEDELLLKAPGAFFRAKAREVEVYGDRVLTRARDLARILSAMIKLN